jgi:hypothetical protein
MKKIWSSFIFYLNFDVVLMKPCRVEVEVGVLDYLIKLSITKTHGIPCDVGYFLKLNKKSVFIRLLKNNHFLKT